VIVVDMQNDFGSKGGMFDRAGIDILMIQRAVAPTARVLAAARKADIRIIYLKMAFRPDLSDMGLRNSPNWRDHQRMGVGTAVHAPNGTESRILVRDTWNTDIVSDLKPAPADTLIYKHRFSGFYQTDLDPKLKGLGARYLIFTGCTTSVCVESTVRDAMFRDYSPLLLADCTGEPVAYGLPRSNHETSLLLIGTMFGLGIQFGAIHQSSRITCPISVDGARRSAVDDSGWSAIRKDSGFKYGPVEAVRPSAVLPAAIRR
jgi:ureidoacrylate peracid hydrolase